MGRASTKKSQPCVQEMEHRHTDLGPALYIRIYTNDYRQLTWPEVWAKFSDSYPGQWAVEAYPPADQLVDDTNIYHLFVLDEPPRGLNIKR